VYSSNEIKFLGIPAHGFDSVHIGNSLSNPKKTSLFLGESKLLRNGENGVDELLNDIEKQQTIQWPIEKRQIIQWPIEKRQTIE
jgi:hypothetical protein